MPALGLNGTEIHVAIGSRLYWQYSGAHVIQDLGIIHIRHAVSTFLYLSSLTPPFTICPSFKYEAAYQ